MSPNFVQTEHALLPIIVEFYKSSNANLGLLQKQSEKIRNWTETYLFNPATTNFLVWPEPFVVIANKLGQASSGQNHDLISLLRQKNG
jgi:hypothetical protein